MNAARFAPAAAAAVRISAMSSSPSPGITGATLTPTSSPAAASRAIVLSRRCGVATNGSMARALSGSQNGTDTLTPTRAHLVEAHEHVEVALDERRLGDDADGVAILGADLEAAARQPVATPRAADSSR